jgi:hypothetical protein
MENIKNKYFVCLNNEGYEASLEIRKIYESIPDSKANKHHQIRIIDESGEDYYYPVKNFMEIRISHTLEEALLKAA